jgi:hypothetical protein
MPFKDIGDYGISTGGYPWRIDGNYQSRVFITNVGKVRAAFGGSIRPDHGPDYFIDTHYLEVGETAIFDVRQIRDQQTPDSRGATLSKDANVGQFDWTTIFGDGSQRFIGRNEVIDRSAGVSASFSCGGICTCPDSTLSAFVTPASPIVGFNGTTGVIATGTTTNSCGGSGSTNFTIYPAPWTISTPGIFTLSSGQASSTMTGTQAGSSFFYTPFSGTNYVWNGQSGQCVLNGNPPLNPGGTGKVMALTCSPSSVVRGSNATCSVTNAPSATTFSGWKFTDSSNNNVSRGGNNNIGSWSGIIVTRGTVHVTAGSTTLSASITLTARSSLTFAAVLPTGPVANGSSPTPSCTLSVPSPPYLNSLLGLSCLAQASNFTDAAVSDSGPNQGYRYVTTATNSYQGTPTGFYYVISPELKNTASSFYKAQTGTYNAQTNPNGYISGSNLLADAIRHESGPVNSHYQNYVTAQNNPAYNLGVVAEAEIGPPSQTQANFESKVQTDMTAAKSTIQSQENIEPCNSKYVGYNAACVLQGYVNYTF